MFRPRLSPFLTLILASTYGCNGGTGPEVDLRIDVVAGGAQTGDVGAPLMEPVIIRVSDSGGKRAARVEVEFEVASGGGTITGASTGRGAGAPAVFRQVLMVVTDGKGEAAASWSLGPTAGAQTMIARILNPDESGDRVQVTAQARAGPPASIELIRGSDQMGQPGETLEVPFLIRIRDHFNNPAPGTQVTWQVTSGGGSVVNASTRADEKAMAEARLVLGESTGINAVRARAGTAASTVSALALNTVLRDDQGDTFQPPAEIVTAPDVIRFGTGVIGGDIVVRIVFVDTIAPDNLQHLNSINGVVEFDTDRNSATGRESVIDGIRTNLSDAEMGVDAYVQMEQNASGAYRVFKRFGDKFLSAGEIMPVFGGRFVTLNIPLSMIDSDGRPNVTAAVASIAQWSDIVPNAGHIKVDD